MNYLKCNFKGYFKYQVIEGVLKDPYCLYEKEYEDIVECLGKQNELE